MDLGLERDLDLQVQVQPQPQRVGLAAAPAAALLLLLVHGIVGDAAEGVGHAALEPLCRLPDAAQAGLVERAAASLLLLLLLPALHLALLAVPAVGPLRWLVLLLGAGLLRLGLLVGLLLLLLLAGAAFLFPGGRHAGLVFDF